MTTISGPEFARMVGIAGRQVRNLVERGVMVRQGDGFDLEVSINRYCAFLRDAAQGRGGDAAAERARLARARAEHAETKNSLLRGDLLRADEVQSTWCGIARSIRAALLAVPSRFASRVPDLTPHHIRELDAEIRAALTELSETHVEH